MRLTGSFHTIVTQGRSGATSSSWIGSRTRSGAMVTFVAKVGARRRTGATRMPPWCQTGATGRLVSVRTVNTAAPQLPSSALFTDQYELTMLEGALLGSCG